MQFLKSTIACCAMVLAICQPTQARVTRIVVDETTLMPTPAGSNAMAYQQIAGRAFGELDPKLPQNSLIQDIELAKEADGKVRYVSSFVIYKPVDSAKASGLMWHDVPNRGRVFPFAPQERAAGDVMLASAWQGDNVGATTVRATASVAGMQFLQLPVARGQGGAAITGEVFGRIVNRSGAASQPLMVQTNPVPYKPVSLDTVKAKLVSRGAENQRGEVTNEQTIAPTDWAWAKCDAAKPFPGTPDPTQICLKSGFDANKLYQVVFTAADPYVLGIGFAAFRDLGVFFKTAAADDSGTPNPVAKVVTHSIARGISQSGNYLRGWLHLGFNQAENGAMVHEGMWPIIAGRRIALNFRWAQPDGVLELYQAGSEGPQWWLPHADTVRGLPAAGILERCSTSRTCPKIIEHFGSAEVWALKLTPEWVGTDAKADLPLPDNVRRYYIASSNHGGGAGGFDTSLPGVGLPSTGAVCPGNNFGAGILPANPVPHLQTGNALRAHFRAWVMQGKPPPPSRYPTLAAGQLAPANKAALGWPTLPGLRATAPEADFIMPVYDYDWGPQFNAQDGSGIASNAPPRIKQVLAMLAPKVDVDGNELGGVPVALLDAPLGTYLGWNITASGFHKGQICNYVGGMIPFARTADERKAKNDPRLSLQERYGSHAGYVAAVRKATDNATVQGFLLPEDATALVAAAQASFVLREYAWPKEGSALLKDFRFHTGQVLPALRMNYTTLGDPKNEAVLVLHGTTGNGAGMLQPVFGGELFGAGQPLDAAKYFIILPDSVGTGKSSKPSDGMRAAFPLYNYTDAVLAQYRLVTEGLGIKHLRLVIGNSMGGMQTWMWGAAYPGFMDALVPMASQPTEMSSRNWILRRLVTDSIRNDPDWKNGNYTQQPRSLQVASVFYNFASNGGNQALQKAAPTRALADALLETRLNAPFAGDANDHLYQWDSSRDYNPAAGLERISAALLAINSADDERNPPETGTLEREIKRVKNGRIYLVPASEFTAGHGTTFQAKFWKSQLSDLLQTAPRLGK
jgi:homoserine acetyltransferase